MDSKRVTIISSIPILRETFRYWLLSFLNENIPVDTASFGDVGSDGGWIVFLIFSDADLREAAEQYTKSATEVIAITPPCCRPSLLRGIEQLFPDYLPMERCMPSLVSAIEGISSEPITAREPQGHLLTERELQVLRLIAQGAPLKEISYRLGISRHTVVSYRRSLYLKTGAHSLQQLALYATLHVNASGEY